MENKLSVFKGIIERIEIVSDFSNAENSLMYNRDSKQRIVINNDASVEFMGYGTDGKERRNKTLTINQKDKTKIFEMVAGYFSKDHNFGMALGAGIWKINLTDSDGEDYAYCGMIGDEVEYDGISLSEFIRESVGIGELYVFDGEE